MRAYFLPDIIFNGAPYTGEVEKDITASSPEIVRFRGLFSLFLFSHLRDSYKKSVKKDINEKIGFYREVNPRSKEYWEQKMRLFFAPSAFF